jgi:catechol 2,3-dioxygenase-like lactoylglutathione lyase family enzyme
MFSHIMIGTNDLERAKAFYDSLLATLGVPPARVDGHRICGEEQDGRRYSTDLFALSETP